MGQLVMTLDNGIWRELAPIFDPLSALDFATTDSTRVRGFFCRSPMRGGTRARRGCGNGERGCYREREATGIGQVFAPARVGVRCALSVSVCIGPASRRSNRECC